MNEKLTQKEFMSRCYDESETVTVSAHKLHGLISESAQKDIDLHNLEINYKLAKDQLKMMIDNREWLKAKIAVEEFDRPPFVSLDVRG